jgi:hypothetical protein
MNYFKYTYGESFTLNGFDYFGSVNVNNGIAYTGYKYTEESEQLIPKSTFFASLMLREFETNSTYKNVDQPVKNYSNYFDVFNKQGLDELANNISDNNIICFKSIILSNPTVYKYEENDCFFYGLSGNGENITLDTIPTKQGYLGHIEPFSKSINFKFLDSIFTGIIVVNSSEDFKYVCSNGESTYTFIGNFADKTPLQLIDTYNNIGFVEGIRSYDYPDYVFNIHYDQPKNKVLYVKSSTIEVHDAVTYGECSTTILEDIIGLQKSTFKFMKWNTPNEIWNSPHIKFKWGEKYTLDNANNPKTIKFGLDYRTQIDKTNTTLSILNKYSSNIIKEFSLSSLNIGEFIDIDIRPIDDHIIVLHQIDQQLKLLYFNPFDLSTIKHSDILSIDTSATNLKIKFVDYDSDVFIVSNTKEYQTRFLSNPTYPSGRLETCELDYAIPAKWNENLQLWNYIRDKWDSSSDLTNSYNNLHTSTSIKNHKMYMLLHNHGRLYAISQPVNDRLLTPIPLNLLQKFDGSTCSNSSIGLELNKMIRTLIDDTIGILQNSANTFNILEREILYKEIEDYNISINNLYMNGNETFNVLTLQRILLQIFEIQQRIIPNAS